jgi:hypothetical protein
MLPPEANAWCMESSLTSLIPLPNTYREVEFLEVGEGKCDFPGCGKVLTKRGMGRHKAIHARNAPANPNDAIVEKLRIRCRQHIAQLFAIVTEWDNVDDKPELRDVVKHVIALHADLDVLGVI